MPSTLTFSLTPLGRELVLRYQHLPYYIVSKFFRQYRREVVLWDCLKAHAVQGLMYAVHRYRTNHMVGARRKGQSPLAVPAKFITFASYTIWGFCKREIAKFLRKPHEFRTPIHQDELRGDVEFGDLAVATEIDPLASASNAERATIISEALRFIDPLDRLVLELSFGLNGHPQTDLAAIATALGVSRERVAQRLRRAKARLATGRPNAILERARCA